MHGHTHQLMGHFHGDFVVCDIDKLHLAGHLLHHARVAPDVGVIQRCIHLIQHTERRRVQTEDGEHQCYGRQSFLAAGQEVNGTVLFARWAGHDGDARVEHVFPGKFEVGVAATEDLGK